MSRDDAILRACERLFEALAADLLDAAEDEILGSHTPAAARVAADALRQHLSRAVADRRGTPAAADVPAGSPRSVHRRPEGEP